MANKIYFSPPSSERKYRKLVALGKELGVPVPQVFLEMEVKMTDGRVVHHHRQRSHSWVRNLYNLTFGEVAAVNLNALGAGFGAGQLNLKNTAGGTQTGATPAATSIGSQLTSDQGYTQAAGTITSGIVVGSNIGAESFEDYVLLTPIANGNGAGQLAYALSDAYVVAYVAGTKTMSVTIVRYMNNNSAGDVTVREVALEMSGVAFGNCKFMNSRDHIADVVIPATGQLKVTYVISLVYPA